MGMRRTALLLAAITTAWRFARSERGRTLYRRLQHMLRRRGVLGTVRRTLVELPSLLRLLRPSHRRDRAAERAAERAADATFDQIHSVDTGGKIHPAAMHDIESENWVYSIGYEPTQVELFERMIDASDIEPHRFSFIDYGSGKGRVLLLAARFPFRRVVGVEHSPKLHRVAEKNLRSIRFAERRSGLVESICIDAVQFRIPEESVVLYFYNPFERTIMDSVRDNVVRSYEGNPKNIVVIYLNPLHSDVWDEVGFLKRHACSDKFIKFIIYKTTHSHAPIRSDGRTLSAGGE
jgi:predicted O-methyltransferase YrrM